MSSPPEPPDQQSSNRDVVDAVPGCGLAAYAGLLGIICLVGLVGILGGAVLLIQPSKRGPSPLMPGTQVAVWRLAPLRATGLAELNEVPAAFHDETIMLDGEVACFLFDDRLVRVDDGSGIALPYTQITEVKEEVEGRETRVEVVGREGTTIPCTFRRGEGAERFARQLRVEAGLPLPD